MGAHWKHRQHSTFCAAQNHRLCQYRYYRSKCKLPQCEAANLQKCPSPIAYPQNTVGVMRNINRVFEKHGINVRAQYLQTNETIGYVITDISIEYGQEVINDLKKIRDTIKFRILY